MHILLYTRLIISHMYRIYIYMYVCLLSFLLKHYDSNHDFMFIFVFKTVLIQLWCFCPGCTLTCYPMINMHEVFVEYRSGEILCGIFRSRLTPRSPKVTLCKTRYSNKTSVYFWKNIFICIVWISQKVIFFRKQH